MAVAYRYTYNGVEYQVGEFSTDVTFDAANPKVLFAKLLKNETTKIQLANLGSDDEKYLFYRRISDQQSEF